ncbi:HlyD family type I secretion periplasmic adaptor subunit [Thiomonas delicata]|uniref:Membrane fusion protein (MFP) family protein n=1 Tax=Thiomonas delicata TaxID=364030 RepID=A0A238D4Y3_THIDL|nr:HlyD family type I secretion periplasmic adaptor subunit [Thiomonas delicata]SBP88281.1 Type I secretion membrane fusion protein, HlyD family [Thiomonas delicata]
MGTDARDFLPGLLAIQRTPPHPAARWVLWVFLALFASLLGWAAFGTLDIVAVAEGKLVPSTYLKIVQPAEAGIVQQILVKEGQAVAAGQVLVRMDAAMSEADRKSVLAEYQARQLALRRIDAELSGGILQREVGDPPALFAQAMAQYDADRLNLASQTVQMRAAVERAQHELAVAEQVRAKLEEALPHYRRQEAAYAELGKDGFAGPIMVSDKARERQEKERELQGQTAAIRASQAALAEARQRLAQVRSDAHQRLQAERSAAMTDIAKLGEELTKQIHRADLMELRAPQAGVVKDLATHTPGTVVQPGAILMSLVPSGEPLTAEVWVSNQDIGFVRSGQMVRLKLATYPFQKYGMVDGVVAQISADAQEPQQGGALSGGSASNRRTAPEDGGLVYRALVHLRVQHLARDGGALTLAPGMRVTAEINLGDRTVLEYLLSPVRKAFFEAGRER